MTAEEKDVKLRSTGAAMFLCVNRSTMYRYATDGVVPFTLDARGRQLFRVGDLTL